MFGVEFPPSVIYKRVRLDALPGQMFRNSHTFYLPVSDGSLMRFLLNQNAWWRSITLSFVPTPRAGKTKSTTIDALQLRVSHPFAFGSPEPLCSASTRGCAQRLPVDFLAHRHYKVALS